LGAPRGSRSPSQSPLCGRPPLKNRKKKGTSPPIPWNPPPGGERPPWNNAVQMSPRRGTRCLGPTNAPPHLVGGRPNNARPLSPRPGWWLPPPGPAPAGQPGWFFFVWSSSARRPRPPWLGGRAFFATVGTEEETLPGLTRVPLPNPPGPLRSPPSKKAPPLFPRPEKSGPPRQKTWPAPHLAAEVKTAFEGPAARPTTRSPPFFHPRCPPTGGLFLLTLGPRNPECIPPRVRRDRQVFFFSKPRAGRRAPRPFYSPREGF